MKGQNWPLVSWLLKVQFALTIVVAIVTALMTQGDKGGFVMLGGGAVMLLTAVAALRAFAVDANENPKAALVAIYRGLAIKSVGAVVFFVLVAKSMPQYLVFAVIGYVAATVSYWIALLWAPLLEVPRIESQEPEN